jgi:tetratricopeptide (TPR) repeat protein
MFSKRILFLFLLSAVGSLQLAAQENYNIFLARQFAEEGELAKAAEYYEKVANSYDGLAEVYEEYLTVLIQMKAQKEEEKLINKAYQIFGKDPLYLADLYFMYQRLEDGKNAEKTFNRLLNDLKANPFQINMIAGKFIKAKEYDLASSVYRRAKVVFRNEGLFNLELAQIAGLKGDEEQMIIALVQEAEKVPESYTDVVKALQVVVGDSDKEFILERELLKALGRNKNNVTIQELLIWLYMQQNDFESALEQARAIDLYNQEDGRRLVSLARVAANQRNYETAIKGYQYVIDKGPKGEYFVTASLELINTRRDMLVNSTRYTRDDLWALRSAYENFLSNYYNIYTTTSIAIDLADLEARYLFRLDTAIQILQTFLSKPGLNRDLAAKAKLALGDYYIMKEEPWESVLLYTQVEKEFKGTPTGEEAKYRNARLSYFKGDFEWALTQLKVIKGNTSEFMSNDAIELAVFISDNFNQDQEEDKVVMKQYAKTDLLFFQNKIDDAREKASQMLKQYSGHPLEDDLFYLMSKIARKEQDFEQTANWLKRIAEEYPFEILGDDATFELGELYERQLYNPEEAMKWYEKIILEFKDSTFVVEARKRYRKLRGDDL